MSNKIQHKLYNYEQVPPESVWSKISSELDLHAKLYSAEVTPPAAAWDKIEDALNEGKPKRIIPLFRYAAAAVIIGLMTWAGLRLINTNKSAPTVVKTNPPAEEKIKAPEAAPANNNDQVAVNTETEDARNDAALEASKKTYAKLDGAKKKRLNTVSGFHFSGFTSADAIPSVERIQDRYIVLMNPDGNFIRVSKKLSNMVCCVSGEEQDADCKDQMEKWRKQLACSSASHPGNFLDILDLVSSLQD